MPVIKEYIVVEPPTSGEVRQRYNDAIQKGGLLELVLLGREQVPTPEPTSVKVQITQTEHSEEGVRKIAGRAEDYPSVVVSLEEDLDLPASASTVSYRLTN